MEYRIRSVGYQERDGGVSYLVGYDSQGFYVFVGNRFHKHVKIFKTREEAVGIIRYIEWLNPKWYGNIARPYNRRYLEVDCHNPDIPSDYEMEKRIVQLFNVVCRDFPDVIDYLKLRKDGGEDGDRGYTERLYKSIAQRRAGFSSPRT